ncbi:hypothetical protein TKK_0002273 [Trichogramma kaykai]
MWPILGSCDRFKFNQIIGLFVGNGHPGDFNEFLTPFVNEAMVSTEQGLLYKDVQYEIDIVGLICDAPAKADVLQTKHHSGFNSCSKCKIHGITVERTRCYPDEVPEPD